MAVPWKSELPLNWTRCPGIQDGLDGGVRRVAAPLRQGALEVLGGAAPTRRAPPRWRGWRRASSPVVERGLCAARHRPSRYRARVGSTCFECFRVLALIDKLSAKFGKTALRRAVYLDDDE